MLSRVGCDLFGAPAKLDHRLVGNAKPGCRSSGDRSIRVIRVHHELEPVGERETTLDGNGAVERALLNEVMNDWLRLLLEE
jgi:hypothetical protein